jgi:acyl dehydratase
MVVQLDRIGTESSPTARTWRPRDCSLYALALGAGFGEPAFTLESRDGPDRQKVYPTFALSLMAAESAAWPDPTFGAGDFDLHDVVLGQQSLVLHRPLGPAGDVRCVSRLAAIYDKGSGALVSLEVRASDAGTGDAVFTGTADLFVVGQGGFGGDRGPARPPWVVPARAPDHVVAYPTLAVQSLLYRHAGNDANPVHVDAAFARRAGFEGPILTGQNSLGFAGRAIVETVAGGDPVRVRSIEGRFSAAAYNGDTITTELWAEEGANGPETGVVFRVRSQRGDLVVDHGVATLA